MSQPLPTYALRGLFESLFEVIQAFENERDTSAYLERRMDDAQKVIDEQNADNLVGRRNYEELARYSRGIEHAKNEYGLRLVQLGNHVGVSPEIMDALLQLPPDFRAYEYIPGPVGPPPASQEALAPEMPYNPAWQGAIGSPA